MVVRLKIKETNVLLHSRIGAFYILYLKNFPSIFRVMFHKTRYKIFIFGLNIEKKSNVQKCMNGGSIKN